MSHQARFDPLELEVMAHSFAAVAEEMGAVLVRAALSPNIRERLDCSAAIFDAEGGMVAQAAHIPVHLGAMPDAVRAVLERHPEPGDVFILNDPFRGGSHLPDLTLVEAIDFGGRITGFAAVRAHHADVGGMSPGSMPRGATEQVQEGLVLPPVRLARGGKVDEDILGIILANVRTPLERSGDLRAQINACAVGADEIRALIEREGEARVWAAGAALMDYSERRALAAIAALGDRSGSAADVLEGDGLTEEIVHVRVAVSVRGGRLRLDFTGTSSQRRGNINCPISVTRAAATMVLRSLLPDDVPTNGGVARAIEIAAPPGCAVNALWPAAVAAGNVEMSQRLADVMFAALDDAGLDVPAMGQGTMNNITFGGEGWTFYETIGGGQGASSRGEGPSAVHVGMSNTRNTPIESLEWAYPIRIDEYAIRRDSGGAGLHRGGDGVVRSYRVLEPCTVTLLTERRRFGPPGSRGGRPGAPGRNLLNGRPLPAKCRLDLCAGDVVTIETPGGGGWGGGESREQ
ncbi:MAG TPA: hydantoinase B/oxoprolinase family protein [Gemmatimonadaceae bacterium]|nr:hydantoinase B/oxoprolinase family protein [Gemmatimonadaceae bacterium]